jgi:hypothetical protein
MGTVSPAEVLDERALRWHVFVWDLWLVVWGITLAVALLGSRRENPQEPASRQAGDERRHPFSSGRRHGSLGLETTKEQL